MERNYSMQSTHTKRILWIDIAKGIAMILVFYGHIGSGKANPPLPMLNDSIWVVYLFHMPLFFILSGLTFNPNKKFFDFFLTRFKRLIIPYFFFSLYALGKIILNIMAPSVFAGFNGKAMGTPLHELANIFLGNTLGLWFLFALFWGDLVLYCLNRFTKNLKHTRIWLGILFSIAGITWFTLNTLNVAYALPFQIVHAIEAVAFVGFGWIAADRLKNITVPQAGVLLAASFVAFTAIAYLCRQIDLSSLGGWLFAGEIPFLIAAILGSLLVIAIARLLPIWDWLSYIGRNTLIFYGLNGLSMAVANKVIFTIITPTRIANSFVFQFFVGLIIVLCACLVCAFATPILKRWFWWGVGVSRPKRAITFIQENNVPDDLQ